MSVSDDIIATPRKFFITVPADIGAQLARGWPLEVTAPDRSSALLQLKATVWTEEEWKAQHIVRIK